MDGIERPIPGPVCRCDGLRLSGFAAALVVYGAFGTPAPQGFGGVELAVGLCLVLFVGVARPVRACFGAPGSAIDGFECAALPAFLLLLWMPLTVGMLAGWEASDIVRDLVPLGFLFLPLLAGPAPPGLSPARLEALATVFALSGTLFALRWWAAVDAAPGDVGRVAAGHGDGYLLNGAAVPFAAVWFVLSGVRRLTLLRTMPAGLGALCAALPPLAALPLAVNRGAALLVGLSISLGILAWTGRHGGRWLALAAIGLPALSLLWPRLDGALLVLLSKTDAVGGNGRGAELEAVLRVALETPVGLLLGQGWGTRFADPAVGWVQVSYTHNLFTYMLLKAGVVGLAALVLYLAALARPLWEATRRYPALVLSAVPSLAAALMLHTSFKYLCIGCLLTLLRFAATVTNDPYRLKNKK